MSDEDKDVNIKDDTCPDCNGTGEVIDDSKIHSQIIDVPYKRCPNCGGSGKIEQD